VVWPATVTLLSAAIGVRLFFEMRRCAWAIGSLIVCSICFLLAGVAAWDWPLAGGEGNRLFAQASWLVGHVFMLATFLLYSRHVQLDATGRTSARSRSKESQVTRASEGLESDGRGVAPALRLRTDLDPVESPTVDVPRAEPASPLAKHLSKAERRRLRREARLAS
jgi:hypothetical protein